METPPSFETTVDPKFRVLGNDGKNIPQTMDARAWAIAFVYAVQANPKIPSDEGCMIGWYANAIMAGYDAGKARAVKELATIADELKDKLAKSPPVFADYRKYQCETCKGEATLHLEGTNWYFCGPCLTKIESRERTSLA